MLIDFELAGPNYRGFDLIKLFRTGGATPCDAPRGTQHATSWHGMERRLRPNWTSSSCSAQTWS
jgi:thiamine kinase-like enzyme